MSKKFAYGFATILSLFAAFQLAAAPKEDPNFKLEKLGESGISRITLTPEAATRLGIQTAEVSQEKDDDDKPQVTIPYKSIIYDIQGRSWVYTNPEPNIFVRDEIKIDEIDDEMAILNQGPAIGTKIVTVGVAELYGVEKGIGK